MGEYLAQVIVTVTVAVAVADYLAQDKSQGTRSGLGHTNPDEYQDFWMDSLSALSLILL